MQRNQISRKLCIARTRYTYIECTAVGKKGKKAAELTFGLHFIRMQAQKVMQQGRCSLHISYIFYLLSFELKLFHVCLSSWETELVLGPLHPWNSFLKFDMKRFSFECVDCHRETFFPCGKEEKAFHIFSARGLINCNSSFSPSRSVQSSNTKKPLSALEWIAVRSFFTCKHISSSLREVAFRHDD